MRYFLIFELVRQARNDVVVLMFESGYWKQLQLRGRVWKEHCADGWNKNK